MVRFLFILSIMLIPFNDFNGIGAFGEMQHELSAYLFLITLMSAMFLTLQTSFKSGSERYVLQKAYLLPKFMIVLFGAIFISFVMNFSTMLGENFRGRYAPIKFMTSTIVVIYGFALAYLSYFMGKQHPWHNLIVRPVGISVAVCMVVAIIEIFSWHGGFTEGFYSFLSLFIHTGSNSNGAQGFMGGAFGWGHTEGRARAVSFEPPALANFAGFAWPWVYAGFIEGRDGRKALYLLLWIMCSILMVMAASRTGIVLLMSNFLVLLVLRLVYLPKRVQRTSLSHIFTFFFWCATVIGVLLLISKADSIADVIAGGDSISNISRFGSMTAAFRMFKDTPIWGYGFGQYGFHVIQYMPDWGYKSWEIRAWFTNPMVVWPPVFSMYARLAAETGLIGLVAWIGIWYYLARILIIETTNYQRMTGALLIRSYPLVINCFCVLFSGIPSDTLRTPMMWVSLGLSCAYLHEIKSRMHTLHHASKPTASARAGGDVRSVSV